jgi:hypothetical protein
VENLTERQHLLLEWLQARGSASINDIQDHFEVSPATAYRDARALVQSGAAVKTSNGVKIAPTVSDDGKCAFCGGAINERAAFIFQLQDGSQRKACCPHCGLMAMGKMDVVSALASDFLYGRMVNVRQAVFLLESSVNLCCSPSVLCFANEADARSFQSGFGGHICSLEQAGEQVGKIMAM